MSFTGNILNTLKEEALTSADLIIAIITSDYGASWRRIESKARNIAKNREHLLEELEERHKFYNVLSRLKRDGLIIKDNKKWSLTKLGEIKTAKQKKLDQKYEKEDDKTFKIITFDIPETRRVERRWLRKALGELGFKYLQKSVWLGKVKIPQEFLEDLNNRRIFNYLHILEITKLGSVVELE